MYSFVGRILLIGVTVIGLLFLSHDGILHLAALIILAGSGCNLLAVALNGGQMPVHGNFSPDDDHCSIGSHTKFRYLCDSHRIRIHRWTAIVSIGDIVLFAGSLFLFARILTL
jgi:hypothetical protein